MAKISIKKSSLPNNNKLNIKKVIEGSQVSSISGLSLWLKADEGVTTNGSEVTAWNDQSIAGNTPTLDSIGTGNPQYKTNQINGKPCIFFNNTKSFIKENVNFNDWTVIHVSKLYNDPDGLGRIFSNRGASNNILVGSWDNRDNRMYAGNQWVFEGNNTNYTWKLSIGTCSISQNRSFFYQNGQQLAGPVSTSQTLNGFAIGGGWRDDFPERAICDVAEVIIYQKELNSTERQVVQNYLNSKYSIYSSPYVQNGKLRIKTPPPFPTNGLLAFWRLNNADGLSTISSDFGSYTLNTYGGYTSVPGKINNAFNFSSSSEGMWTNEQILNLLTSPTSFSVSFWAKITEETTFCLGNAFGSMGFHFEHYGSQYGSLGFIFRITKGIYIWNQAAHGVMSSLNQWHHIVGTYNHSSATMKLYVNNSLVATTTNVVIGTNSEPNWHGFALNGTVINGGKEYGNNQSLDAVGFWNRDLTISEVATLYNGGNGSEI
jgi:hypothetical protein